MHQIQHQQIEIVTGADVDTQEIGSKLLSFLDSSPAELESAFDRMAAGGDVRVDRIELDLGVLQGRNWLDSFVRRLSSALEREFSGHDHADPFSTAENRVTLTRGLTRTSRAESDFEALIFALREGRLPWWSVLDPVPRWTAKLVGTLTPAAKARLVQIAAEEPKPRARLVRDLETEDLASLLSPRIPSDVVKALPALITDILTPTDRSIGKWARTEAIWRAVFAAASTPDESARAKTFAQKIAAAWSEHVPNVAKSEAVPFGPQALKTLPKPWRKALIETFAPVPPSFESGRAPSSGNANENAAPDQATGPTDDVRPQAHGETAGADAGTGQTTKTDAAPTMVRGDVPQAAPDEAIPVKGAGAVLLHPFLPELFKATGLTEDDQFLGSEEQHLAVRLLSYLLFGTTDTEEVDLVLAKTLCGQDWAEPLLPDQPEPDAIKAADDLLNAVLTHWTALKSSSPDWLRSQFLMREGQLIANDDGWTLRVETQAQDILLGKLPWGYGTVMLPWLPAPITVRWRD